MSARKIDFVRKYDKHSGRWVKQLYSGGPMIVPKKLESVKGPYLLEQGVTGSGHPMPSRKKMEDILITETKKKMDDVGDTILSGLRQRTQHGGCAGKGMDTSGSESIRKRIEGLVMGSGLQVM